MGQRRFRMVQEIPSHESGFLAKFLEAEKDVLESV